MKHVTTTLLSLVGLALVAPAPDVRAQVTTVRGAVLDETGAPLPGVQVEMEFKGESRRKIVRTMLTDKKGGFVRAGLPAGPWVIRLTKAGYKPYSMEVQISLGGLSEIPEVTMAKAASEAPAPDAAGSPGGVEAVLPPDAESAKAGEAYGIAVEAVKAGRLDEAEALFKEVVAKFPGLAGAHYNLGYVYQLKKDWKSAEDEFRRVTEIQPGKSDAFIALAAVRELDGRGPEAVDGLLQAAPSFEQDARFLYALGVTCVNAGRSPEAAQAFRKLQALDPAQAEPYFHLGTIAVGENRVAEAVVQLEKYVSMSGQDPRNLETAKRLLEALKKR